MIVDGLVRAAPLGVALLVLSSNTYIMIGELLLASMAINFIGSIMVGIHVISKNARGDIDRKLKTKDLVYHSTELKDLMNGYEPDVDLELVEHHFLTVVNLSLRILKYEDEQLAVFQNHAEKYVMGLRRLRLLQATAHDQTVYLRRKIANQFKEMHSFLVRRGIFLDHSLDYYPEGDEISEE